MKINKVSSVIIVFCLFGCSSTQIEPTPIFTAIPVATMQPLETPVISPTSTSTTSPTSTAPEITTTTKDNQMILKGFKPDTIQRLFWSKDGSRLFISTPDGIIVYDVANKKIITRLESNVVGQYFVELSPDGNTFAVVSSNNPIHTPIFNISIRLINAETGNLIKTININNFGLVGLTFSPDSKTLAALNKNEEIALWDVATGKEVKTLHKKDYGNYLIQRVYFNPDGKSLVASFIDYTYKVWDTSTWKLQREFFCGDTVFQFNPDGSKFATEGVGNFKPAVWEFSSGEKLFDLSAKSHSRATAIDFDQSGKYIAVSVEHTIYDDSGIPTTIVDPVTIFDANTGQFLRELAIRAVNLKFSPNGTKLALVSQNENSSEIIIWDMNQP